MALLLFQIWVKQNGVMPFLVYISLTQPTTPSKTPFPLSSQYKSPYILTQGPENNQYGGNIVKAHIGRWSEDCPEHQGVVVLGMDDVPLVSSINFFPFRFWEFKNADT